MYLEHATCQDVEDYLRVSQTILIPMGSLENHGRHMPLGTDTLIPQRIAGLVDERYPELMIAPTFHYGSTDDLKGFPGTVSLGIDGLKWLLQTVCDQLYGYGFRRFLVLNGHGGNVKSIDAVGLHLWEKGAYLAYINWWLLAGQLRPEWKGGHGGAEETAAVMGIDPALVRREHLHTPEGLRNDVSEELPTATWTSVSFQGGTVNIPRHVYSVTDNGWMAYGMPDEPWRATPEWGREMLDTMADYVRDFAQAFGRAPLPQGGK